MVYCCCELGENDVSHCCLGELGLSDIFCQLKIVESICVFVCVLISFWLPFSLGISTNRVNTAGFYP